MGTLQSFYPLQDTPTSLSSSRLQRTRLAIRSFSNNALQVDSDLTTAKRPTCGFDHGHKLHHRHLQSVLLFMLQHLPPKLLVPSALRILAALLVSLQVGLLRSLCTGLRNHLIQWQL